MMYPIEQVFSKIKLCKKCYILADPSNHEHLVDVNHSVAITVDCHNYCIYIYRAIPTHIRVYKFFSVKQYLYFIVILIYN